MNAVLALGFIGAGTNNARCVRGAARRARACLAAAAACCLHTRGASPSHAFHHGARHPTPAASRSAAPATAAMWLTGSSFTAPAPPLTPPLPSLRPSPAICRLAGILRNLSSYYYKEPTLLFLVRVAQVGGGPGWAGVPAWRAVACLGATPGRRGQGREAGKGKGGEGRRACVLPALSWAGWRCRLAGRLACGRLRAAGACWPRPDLARLPACLAA